MERSKINLNTKISQIELIDIKLSQIEVGKRFREDLGNLEALAASINKDGLIQPLAVQKNLDSAELPYKLVAGGRRYAALKHLCDQKKQSEVISCRYYPEKLPELQMRVLEFAENLYRKDFTWQEECNLKEHIQDLQQQIHGVKTSTAKDAPGWSLQDLSNMTGKSKGSLSGDISLAKMMKNTPDIDWSKFKTKNDAQKAIKHVKKVIQQKNDAKQFKKTMGDGESKKSKLIGSYHVEDFFKGVKKIGDSTMDFIEIDPPYGIDLEDQKKDYSYTGYNEVDKNEYPTFLRDLLTECFRVLKPNCWLVCWFGPDPWFETVHNTLINAGFKNKRMPAIWAKGEVTEDGVTNISGQTMQPHRDLGKGYEMFFLARKGVPELNRRGTVNVFNYKPVPAQSKVHPTERPVALLKDILNVFAAPGANVLVPFAGSGNTMIAAAQNNMVSIGFDLSQEYFESYIIKIHKNF